MIGGNSQAQKENTRSAFRNGMLPARLGPQEEEKRMRTLLALSQVNGRKLFWCLRRGAGSCGSLMFFQDLLELWADLRFPVPHVCWADLAMA